MLNRFKKCLSLEDKYIHIENDASYYVERLLDGKVLNIYFEWSNGVTDWKNNFDFPAKPYRDMKNMWFCHRGFLRVWKSIEPKITADIMDPNVTEINITGYSHGGAIAQLCYEFVRFHRPEILVTGVGFGAPRVLWGFARKAVRERFRGFMVVRNSKDIVTHLPPVVFGFWHVSDVYEFGEKSDGLVDDHRPENYLRGLAEVFYISDADEAIAEFMEDR